MITLIVVMATATSSGNHLSKVWRSRAWVKTRSAKSSGDLHAFHEEPKRQRALPQNCDRDDERRDVHPQVRSEKVRERIDQVTRPAEHEQDTKQAWNQGRPSDEIPYRHDLKPEKHHLNVEALRWRVRLDEREHRSARHAGETAGGGKQGDAGVDRLEERVEQNRDSEITHGAQEIGGEGKTGNPGLRCHGHDAHGNDDEP